VFDFSKFDLVALDEIVDSKEICDPRKTPNWKFQYIDISSVSNDTFEIVDSKQYVGAKAPSRARKLIRKNDVIFATTRPYLKSIARVPPQLDGHICSTGFCVLRPTRRVLSDWIFYCVISDNFLYQITPKMRGANYPAVTDKDVLAAKVPLPPFDEQRRIVARIKECMELLEEIEKNSQSIEAELVTLFPAILHEKFNEPLDGHPVETLGNIADIKGGGSLPKGVDNDLGEDYVLLVKVGDMNQAGNERIIQVAREYLPASKAGRKVILPWAIIFPKRGGAIATNKKRMLGRSALIDPNLMALVAKPEKVIPEYLYYWTQTFDLTEISSGGIVPQLNRKDLAPLEVPLPDLKVQERIVSDLEQAEMSCFDLETLFNTANQERKALRESVLRKAFAGEL
jgi:type I restriction enzyme, S subunit